MKTTLLYILVLGALIFGVWFFFFKDHNIFSGKDAGFTIRDTGAIGKIFLATHGGDAIKLERTDKGWMIDGKFRAREASVVQLLQTLNAQQAQSPVPEKMHNGIVNSMVGGHIKVELYDRNGGKMRVFYVGGEAPGGMGTYMLMEGGSRPYIVQIPGFTGYLTPRYMPTLNDWRDRMVFNLPGNEITKVIVHYSMEPLNSFTLTKDGDKVDVQIDPSLMAGKELNAKRAMAYPRFFQNLYAEQVANGVGGIREEISRMPQRCSIVVEGKNGYHQDVDMYLMPLNRRSKNLDKERSDTLSYYDADRMYGVASNKQDTLIIQIQMFQRLFRRGYEFYMHEEAPQAAPDAMK